MKHSMRLLGILLLCSSHNVANGQIAGPNTLTSKEIADGWILLFDGQTTFGWIINGDSQVKDGNLIIGGTAATTARVSINSFPADTLSYEAYYEGDQPPEVDAIVPGYVVLAPPPKSTLGTTKITWSTSEKDLRPPLSFRVPAKSQLVLRNVKLKPGNKIELGNNPALTQRAALDFIFNGKDLTGWKMFEGKPERMKSKFSVTKEGWLHVENGPGDLETLALFDDFVLQVECRCNGKHLNSGVFFRCIPNLNLQGYEAQIHNDFTANPPKEYTVDQFDPTSHVLKGTTKVKSSATDYGTGAIYRRVPARKGVARDEEWFTMTIVGQGRHIATWVNGVQQVDWMDERPINENPRNGCRLEKGSISLQGHDPTTDLYFRNLRASSGR